METIPQLHKTFVYRKNGKLHRKQNGELQIEPSELLNQTNGYYYTFFMGSNRLTSRLIYMYHYGEIPKGLLVDHINQDKKDNRIENLRLVTKQENEFNSKAKGYYYAKEGERCGNVWRATIRINNKQINLGHYKTEDKAREAYLSAKEKYHKIEERTNAC